MQIALQAQNKNIFYLSPHKTVSDQYDKKYITTQSHRNHVHGRIKHPHGYHTKFITCLLL